MAANMHIRRGTISFQMLVLLVPVLLALAGFGVDLGRLYLIRGELKTAASAMALAAAPRLIGTEAALEGASGAAQLALANTSGLGNKYDFGSLVIGQTTGLLASEAPTPAYFDTVVAAVGEGENAGASEVAGPTARHVRVTLRAEAPLVFWGLLSLGQERKTPIAAMAVAGVSAPLCTACGIEPIAVAPLDASDTVNFGFVVNTRYTLGYTCNGAPPAPLAGAAQRVNYLLLDRLNPEATVFADSSQQLYRVGAAGLPGSITAARACLSINSAENLWPGATPGACNAAASALVINHLCGLASRFDSAPPGNCQNIAEIDTLSTINAVDSDTAELDDYTGYTGNRRRIITVPIVDTLSAAGAMTVLGFRQFLLEPNQGTTTIATGDVNARFVALYIGSVAPIAQGRFDGCDIASGPGKVVLHQ